MKWAHPGALGTVCTCRKCRRDIRQRIEDTFIAEPRWMGEFTIRERAWLSWVPLLLYRHILNRMCLLGIVIKSHDPSDEFPRYLLARVMVRAEVLAESTAAEGGRR